MTEPTRVDEVGTAGSALESAAPTTVEQLWATISKELAAGQLRVAESLREELQAEMLDISPPEFRELENNLKPWGGEGKPDNLLRRIAAAMAAVGTVPKTGTHAKFSYKYATVDDVVGTCRPVLAKFGIWVNLRVVTRNFEPFSTRDGGTGYNGNMTYSFSAFSADDPGDCVTWEIAGMITNPGEKLDWVAQSQFLKYGLLMLLCLERGNEDAESNPMEGPSDIKDAMRQRGTRRPPQRRQEDDFYGGPPPSGGFDEPPPPSGPPPAGSAGKKGLVIDQATWGRVWERAKKNMGDPTKEQNRIGKEGFARLFAAASANGWGSDQAKATTKAMLGIGSMKLIPWNVVDQVVWIFEHFPVRFFELEHAEEATRLSVTYKATLPPEGSDADPSGKQRPKA